MFDFGIKHLKLTFLIISFSHELLAGGENVVFYLEHGIEQGDYKATRKSLKNNGDPNLLFCSEEKQWMRPLTFAIMSLDASKDEDDAKKRIAIIRLLVESGARINNKAIKCINKIKSENAKFAVKIILISSLLKCIDNEETLFNVILMDDSEVLDFFIKNNESISVEMVKKYLKLSKQC